VLNLELPATVDAVELSVDLDRADSLRLSFATNCINHRKPLAEATVWLLERPPNLAKSHCNT
jgi:hypothetical protein